MEYYSVEEIAKERGVSKQAVYKQMAGRKMSQELDGHIIYQEGKRYVDEEGYRILKGSRNSSPVVYVEPAEKKENEELKRKLAELEAKYEAKDAAMNKMADSLAELLKTSNENAKLAASAQLYLEQKELAEEKFSVMEAEHSKTVEENQTYKNQIEELQKELEKMKNRSLWERLLNK